MARKEPVAKIAKALKRTDGATRQKATVIGLSLKLAPRSEDLRRRAETFVSPLLPVAERGYATHRMIGDVEATRGFHPMTSGAPFTSSRLRASAKLISISRAASR
jgi:hypothetical protein